MTKHCRMSRRSATLLGSFAAASLALPARHAFAADRIAVRLDWTPWGSQAAFHLAVAKGWFAQHGIDVTLEDGTGSVATVQIVGNGQFDAGNASLAPMMIARGRGMPVRAIACFVRQNDIGLIVPEGAGLNRPQDLRGKKLAYTPGSLETPFIDRFLAAGGLKRGDVELLSVDAAAKVGTLVAGRADGVFSAVPFLLPTVQAQRPASAMRFADYGLNFPSFGLVATERRIGEKADALKRFTSVTAGAWSYIAAGHQEEAAQAIIAARPQSRLNAKVLVQQIDLLKSLFVTPATKDQPLGMMAETDWAEAVRNLGEAGQLEKPEPPAAYFTNDLLDPAIIGAIAHGR
jgi:NitT/TauT family transport system substrate-binding protein